jgi:hypothetical protein
MARIDITTAREIAAHMPDGWKAKAPADLDNGVYLDGPDNVRIQITDADHRGTRYEINGRPTREESRQSSYELDGKKFRTARDGITASAAKTPAQIAGEITRRLLPAYLPYLAALRERLNASNAADDRVATYRDALLAAIGTAGSADGDEEIRLHIEDGYGSLQVQSDGGVFFHRLSVPRGLALEIAKAMANYGRTNGRDD